MSVITSSDPEFLERVSNQLLALNAVYPEMDRIAGQLRTLGNSPELVQSLITDAAFRSQVQAEILATLGVNLQYQGRFLAPWVERELTATGELTADLADQLSPDLLWEVSKNFGRLAPTRSLPDFTSQYRRLYYTPLSMDHQTIDDFLVGAAEAGDLGMVIEAVQRDATNFEAASAVAAQRNQGAVIQWLIDAELFSRGRALVGAARGGHQDLVREMLERGAKNFNKALVGAVEGNHYEIVVWMIEAGATDFSLALIAAAQYAEPNIFELILSHWKPRPSMRQEFLEDALKAAIRGGQLWAVERLLSLGAKLEKEFDMPIDGLTKAIKSAANQGYFSVVKRCLELVNPKNISRLAQFASVGAAKSNRLEPVVTYLRLVEQDGRGHAIQDIAEVATENGYREILDLALEQGVENYSSLILEAADGGNLETITYLTHFIPLSNIYQLDRAAERAARRGYQKIVALLLEPGIRSLKNIMQAAAKGCQTDLLIWLYSQARMRWEDYIEISIAAAKVGCLEIVKFLWDQGLTKYRGILSAAAKRGYRRVVSFILDVANPILEDLNSALIDSAKNGHLDVVRLLLEQGANDYDGAIIEARYNYHDRIVNFLRMAQESAVEIR